MKSGQVGPHSVTLRNWTDGDREFCCQVYASTRTEELSQVPWTASQKDNFLRQQFEAQDHAYHSNYPGAEFLIIVVDNAAAGRLYVHRRPDEIRIMDIALLPDFRGRGIGTLLLQQLLEEGKLSSRRVTIHVEIFNPALRLYERLGFSKVSETGVHCLLQWPAARLLSSSS
jgi:ribosomal protein S18 acetylase RimI-like enzyme